MMTMDGGSRFLGRRGLRIPFCGCNEDAEAKLPPPPPLCDVTQFSPRSKVGETSKSFTLNGITHFEIWCQSHPSIHPTSLRDH